MSRDETPLQPIRSAPVRVYLDGKSEVVHPIDLKDWIAAGWGLDPETTSEAGAPEGSDDPNAGGSGSEGGEGEGGEGNVPAGDAPAVQGAKAGAKAGSKSPAVQGAKA